jgi:hypothetical protein
MIENTTKSPPKTLSVAEAGKLYFNLCPRSAYQAVARGEIPVIRIGRLMRVPVPALERMLAEAGQGVAK